jgi:hypothetical protein
MLSPNPDPTSLPTGTTLYRFNGVPVVARPDFWAAPILLVGLMTWIAGLRKPQRSWPQRLGVALLTGLVASFADIGHAMAHTISARQAGAPMDEIWLSLGMPRTLYQNNAVPPRTHIRRALGGPIFTLIGFTSSLLWRRIAPRGSLSRELADASLVGHSFILLGILIPLPVVDGGTILKWKLVEAGQSVAQADQTVRKTDLGLGAALLGGGVLLALWNRRKLVTVLKAALRRVGSTPGAPN